MQKTNSYRRRLQKTQKARRRQRHEIRHRGKLVNKCGKLVDEQKLNMRSVVDRRQRREEREAREGAEGLLKTEEIICMNHITTFDITNVKLKAAPNHWLV